MNQLGSASSKRKVMVGIAEMVISSNPDEVLIAANLGSCLGIAIVDKRTGLSGLIHCLLPLSKSDPEKAANNPCMYVDTGVVHILNAMIGRGCKKENLEIMVAGGANINDASNVFEIGKKNFTIFRKIMWKNELLIAAQDVGENCSRTVSVFVGNGSVTVKKNGQESDLIGGNGNGI